MSRAVGEENRKYPRFEIALPIHFNLNPDYHYVSQIKKLGVAGHLRDVSLEGIGIDSQMDLQDVCQIFSEAIEEDSPFELEVILWDSRGRRVLLRGSVRWYQVDEPENDTHEFKAGLYLRDYESRSATRSIIGSITGLTIK
jgi:hypothetical protein